MKLEEIPNIEPENKLNINILPKEEAYHAEVSVKDGFVHFEFSEFEFSSRTKDCVIKCWVEIAGGKQDEFEQRINILSGNAKSDFVKQLKESFGKEINWSLIFSNVCVKVSEALEKTQVAHSYSDFEAKIESNLLHPFLRNEAVNIFFGMGSSGKTLLALEMGLCVAFDLPFLGFKPQITGNVMLIDYEDKHKEFFDRISYLAADREITPEELDKRMFRFSPNDLPLRDIKNTIKREIIDKQIKLLIVDAAADACGGEPESASVASSFFNTLNSLNVCILLIAHKTKAEDGDKYPFGSVFFYNRPRNVWYIKKDQEEGEELLHIGLIHRKCNYAKKSLPKAVKIVIKDGAIKISEENYKRLGMDLPTKERILVSLEEGSKTLTELAKEISNIERDGIKSRLYELQADGKIKKIGGRWEIFYPQDINL